MNSVSVTIDYQAVVDRAAANNVRLYQEEAIKLLGEHGQGMAYYMSRTGYEMIDDIISNGIRSGTMKIRKRVMISQPMAGKSEAEILDVRNRITQKLEAEGYEIVNSYFPDGLATPTVHHHSLYWLAKSIEVMADCDAVYFCRGWNQHRGCRIEKEAAQSYGLDIMFE